MPLSSAETENSFKVCIHENVLKGVLSKNIADFLAHVLRILGI